MMENPAGRMACEQQEPWRKRLDLEKLQQAEWAGGEEGEEEEEMVCGATWGTSGAERAEYQCPGRSED